MRDFWNSWASTASGGRFSVRGAVRLILTLGFVSVAVGAIAQNAQKPYEPVPGQAGKDSVWVPTPPEMVEKMLDLAKVTSADFVIDLGSGEGRIVIAAAKRGARALGIEYNPKLIALSRQLAEKAGVADKATFVRGDMFKADISKATVMALFMLPEQFTKLTPKFLSLQPGSRIVTNTFEIPKWEADQSEKINGKCTQWCTALLYIVPARVAGTWRLAEGGELRLQQNFQKLTGTLSSGPSRMPIADGRMRGTEISFSSAGASYTGLVNGKTMSGQVNGSSSGSWTATRR
jgi:precorrin-6B methylase 2